MTAGCSSLPLKPGRILPVLIIQNFLPNGTTQDGGTFSCVLSRLCSVPERRKQTMLWMRRWGSARRRRYSNILLQQAMSNSALGISQERVQRAPEDQKALSSRRCPARSVARLSCADETVKHGRNRGPGRQYHLLGHFLQ